MARRILASLGGWQDPQLWLLLVGRLATSVAFALFFPFLSIYFHTERGVPMGTVGGIFLAMGIAAALAKVQGGVLADRWGRKKVMVLALLLRGLTFFWMGAWIASEASTAAIGALAVFSSYLGHFYIPAAHAMISDLATGKRRVDAFGLFRVATNLGWAIGPVLGGKVPPAQYPWLLAGMGVLYVLSGGLLLAAIVESSPGRSPERVSLADVRLIMRNTPFLVLSLDILLIYTVMGQLMAIVSAYAKDFVGLSTSQVGDLFFINGALVVVLQIPLAGILRTTRMTGSLFVGCLLYAAGYFRVGAAQGFGGLVLAMVIITLGEMIVQPAGLFLAAQLSPADQRGRYMGVFGLFHQLGWSIGPYLGGMGLQHFGSSPSFTWGCLSGIAVVAGLGFLFLRRILPDGADQAAVSISSAEPAAGG